MNCWGFTLGLFDGLRRLFGEFLDRNEANLKAEFYLPTAVNALVQKGQARVKVLPTPSHWFGVTYREDRALVMESIRALLRAGEHPARRASWAAYGRGQAEPRPALGGRPFPNPRRLPGGCSLRQRPYQRHLRRGLRPGWQPYALHFPARQPQRLQRPRWPDGERRARHGPHPAQAGGRRRRSSLPPRADPCAGVRW